MSPTGIHVNKQVVAVLSLVICVGVGYYFWSDIKGSVGVGKTETTLEDEEKVEQPKSETKETKNQKSSLDRPLEEKVEQSKSETKGTKTQKSSWDRPLEEKFFKKLKNDSKHFKVIEKRVDVKVEEKTLSIFTRQATAATPKGDVLLLHGQRFTSVDWQTLDTLTMLAAMGYRAIAIDLPGYGQSKEASINSGEIPKFMDNLVSTLNLKAPVIVSPSMSGRFSLPYIMKDRQLIAARSHGYIPIAPVDTGNYSPDQYAKLKLKTVAIYGEKDETTMVQESKNSFKHLPDHEFITIEGAGHPAYLANPDKFHSILCNFLFDVFS